MKISNSHRRAPAHIVMAALALAVGAIDGAALSAQKPVEMADLRARTPQERALAIYYDRMGGNTPIVTGGAVMTSEGPGFVYPSSAKPPTYSSLLHQRVCDADAVIVGDIASSRVILNTKESYLFTFYAVRVERTIRPIYVPSPLAVGSPGGEVTLSDGRHLQAGLPRQEKPHERYVMFLKRTSSSDAYAQLPALSIKLSADTIEADAVDATLRDLLDSSRKTEEFLLDLEEGGRNCSASRS